MFRCFTVAQHLFQAGPPSFIVHSYLSLNCPESDGTQVARTQANEVRQIVFNFRVVGWVLLDSSRVLSMKRKPPKRLQALPERID